MAKFTSNKKVWNKMKRRLRNSNDVKADVGYFNTVYTTGKNRGTPVAYIAQLNNEGIGVPARDFFHHSIYEFENTKELKQKATYLMSQVAIEKVTKKEAMKIWGQNLKGIVERSITYWVTPPNHESTIREKGKDDPLRETDLMLNSVKVKVRRTSNE